MNGRAGTDALCWCLLLVCTSMAHAGSQVADIDKLRLFYTPAERAESSPDNESDREQVDALLQSSTGKYDALESAETRKQMPSGNHDSIPRVVPSRHSVTFEGLITSGRRFTVLINGLPCQYLILEPQTEVDKRYQVGLNCPQLTKDSLDLIFLVEERRVQVRSHGRLLGELSIGHSL